MWAEPLEAHEVPMWAEPLEAHEVSMRAGRSKPLGAPFDKLRAHRQAQGRTDELRAHRQSQGV